MFKLTCVLIFLLLNVNYSFEFVKHGRCPHVRSNPFDLFMFRGNWFEVQRTPHHSRPPQKCTANNILFNNINNGHIINRHINQARLFESREGKLKVIRDDQYYTFLETLYPGAPPNQNQIIATDYNTYAIFYSCTPLTVGLNPTNEVQCSVWSRNPHMTPGLRAVVRSILLQKGIPHCADYLRDCDQTNCPR